MSRLAKAFGFFALTVFASSLSAAPLQLRVLIDGDRNPATGCSVAVAGTGGFSGVERVVIATVEVGTSTPTVSGISIQRCTGDTLGDAVAVPSAEGAATYATDSGQMLAELGIPWSSLDLGATASSVRLGFVVQVGQLQQAVLANGSDFIIYPPPNGRHRAVGVNAATITVDGLGGDWGGIAPLSPGAPAGGSAALRLEKVFAHASSSTLWFRLDAKLSGNAPVAADDTYSVRQGKSVTIPTPGVLTNDSDPNNEPLTAKLVTQPTHGSVNLAPSGGFTYVHDGTPTPADSFEYKANNGKFDSNTARVDLEVTANGAPDANNDNYSVAHRGTLTIAQPGVLANDSDPDGDTIRAILVTAPKFGTLALAQNGSFTYTHNGSNTLSDVFTYRASDGTSQSASARVTITIGADQPPVGTADAYTVAEGATLNVTAPGVLANDTDPDTPANLLIATVVSNPAHGTLTLNSNGSFTYVHDGSETTSDSFTYTVGDGIATSGPVTVTITVTPVNDAPVAVADSYSTNEDTPLAVPAAGVLANDTDAENNPLTASLVTNAANGNVVLNANGGFTYTPNANFNGSDSFTYAATDGTSPSNTVTVTITVAAVNDAPSFTGGANVTVNEDSGAYANAWATGVSAGPADEAGQALTFNVSNSNNALFSVQPSIAANGTLTFTPAANANGTATVTVTLSDNGSNTPPNVNTSTAQTFTITVNAVNDAPTFVAGGNVTVGEDSGAYSAAQASGMLAGPADEAGQTLTFNTSNDNNALFAAQPAIASDGTLTFTPAPNASGVATVTVTLSDNGGTANGGVDTSAPQTFTITVSGVNDAPVITRPATASVNEDATLAFTGGNAISIADVDAGNGNVTLTLGVSNGTLSFGATAGITVSGDGTNAITASGPLVSLDVALSTLSYTPTAQFSGSDTLSISVNDNGNSGAGGPLTDSQTVAITVNAVNDAPTVSLPAAQTTDEDTPLTFSSGNGNAITVADIDAGSSNVSLTLSTTSGTITIGNTAGLSSTTGDGTGNVTISGTVTALNAALEGTTFNPTANLNGGATIDVVVDDGGNTGTGGALQANGTITVTINAVNDGPTLTAPAGPVMATEDTPITLSGANTVTVSDIDAGSGALTLTMQSTNGTVTLASTTGLTVSGDGTALVTASGTLANINAALNGATFTPGANFSGGATLDITIDDNGNTGAPGGSTSDTANIFILVMGVNDPPVATADSYSTSEDTPLNVAAPGVLTNDTDVENNSLTAVLVTGPSNASSFTLNSDGSFSYTPTANFNGSDSFTYKANDGLVDSNVVTVTITVSAINDAPVVTRPVTVTTNEDTPITFSGTISLADLDAGSGSETLTLSTPSGTLALSGTAGLTVSGNGTSSITASGTLANLNAALNGLVYTPVAEFAGGVTLTIGVNDNGNSGAGGALSDSKTTSITINAVNDAPVNSVPGPQTVDEDTTLTFSSANGNAITISDIDAGSADVTVTLSSANGTLTLGSTAGLTTVTGNGTGTVVLTGPITAINAAMNGTVFTPTTNFAGATAVNVATNDNGNTGAGGAAGANSSITVNVTAVNDAPSITRPATATTNEDTPFVFNGGNVISIADTDAASGSVTVTLGVSNGAVTLSGTVGLTVSGNGTNSVTASGTLTNLNNALNGLTYAPALNYNGADTLTIGVNDNGNTGTGGALTDSKSVAITINAQNDAPVAVADSYSTNEDTSLVVSAPGVKSNDSDVDTPAASLTAVLVTGPANASSFTLNSDGSFNYTPNANFSGSDSFTYKVNDGALDSNTVTVTITVIAVDDAPVNTVPAGTQNMNQDSTLVFTGATAISTSDVDAGSNPVEVTLTATNGTVTLSGTAGLSFTTGDGTADASMVFTGTISAVNTALNNLAFTSTPGYFSGANATLTIATNDQGFTGAGGPLTDSDTIQIFVQQVNQPPVNSVPSAQTTNEDSTLTFSTGNGNAITTSDPDAGANNVQITVSVTSGILNLVPTGGVTINNNGTATVTATGSITNLNTALNGLTYLPTLNFTGTDTLTLVTNDLGNSGPGGAKSDTDTVTININAVNDAPVITRPATVNATEDTTFTFNAGNTISVADIDAASGSVTVTLGVTNGVLTLSGTTGLTVSGNGSASITASGTLTDINNALNGVTYLGNANFNGSDTLTIGVNDNGNTGSGGALTDSKTTTINVAAVNDAPAITAGATLAYTEDDPATVIDATITITDIDSTTLSGATVQITGNLASGQDVLSFTNTANITGVFTAGTGTLTLSGADTLANYQAALRTVKYNNTSQNPSGLARTISWQVNDGAASNNLSNVATSTVTVTPVNDAPVLTAGGTLNYTENGPATAIDTTVTVTDVDSTNLTGATVSITANLQANKDVLSFTNTANITGTYNGATGVLTLTGTDTVANYQTALRSVKYNSTSEDPITAPRTITWQVNDGGAVNNLSNQPTSTVNVTAVNDPPVAVAYTNLPAQAGIPITYPAGKLSAADDPEEAANGTVVTLDTTPINLTNIGSITINANGSFTVTPLPGAAGGTASFQYRASDNGRPGAGANGSYVTVSFAVAGPAIYFVKNPAVGLGNCTLGNECLVATAVSNIGASTNAYIFLGDANTHAPAAALTLNSGGSIIGQGLTGFASFDAFFGIGTPAQGVLAARPSIGQPRPTLNTPGAVTLHNNSQLRGFNMTAGNNSSAIVAASRTGLAIDLGTVSTNTPGAATTYAVDLTGPSSGTLFNFGAITASGGGANANGVRFNATSTTTVTFSTINTTLGAAFSSNGTGATNFTFGNITSTAGAAVNVGTSTGNFTFANVSSTTGAAVTTSTTGAGNFTFSAVSSTTGRAVDVNTGTGAFSFTSIAANGSATGILVQNLTGAGSFTVNGSGTTAGTGGTIQNCTAKGGDFRNVASLTLKNMNFTNNATANAAAATVCGDIVSGSNNGPTNCNANISLSAGTANILIQNVSATGSKQIGIDGNTISNLTLNGVTVTGNGNEVGEDGVQLYNPSGTLSVSNTSLFKDNAANQFEVGMSTGTLNSTFTASTFSLTNFPTTAGGAAPSPGNATANAGLLFHANAGSNAAMNATVTGCTFSKIYSYALRWDSANGTSTGTINFGQTGSGNTFTDNGLGIGISSTGNGAITYNIKDNTLTNNTAVTSTFSTSPVSTSFSANATRTGVVDNNTIGVNGGAVNSGCFVGGCSGLELTDSGAQGTHNLTVTNNKVFHVAGSGILVTSSSGSTETLRVKITNNLVAQYDGASANPGIMVQDGNTTPNGVTATCVDISNNTVQGLWASSTTHKSAIRILSQHAIQFSLTNFNSGTDYTAGVVAGTCTTQCTGTAGADGNVADFLSQQNPATVTAQGSTGGSSASQNRVAAAAPWTGAAGACP